MSVAPSIIEQIPYPSGLDYSNQSIEVPGTRRPGQTGHYRNAAWSLLSVNDANAIRTLPQIFESGLAKSADKPFTGYRPIVSSNPLIYANHFVWETYQQVDEHRRNIGSALHKLFAEHKAGGGELETVGIWSQNRPEWQFIDLALHAYGKVGVSLYDTLGMDSVEYIIQHAHLTIVFAASQHLPTLLSLAPKLPMLKIIVSIDELNSQTKTVLKTWAKERNVQILELSELEAMGSANRINTIPASTNDIASICYTSGTTNVPKGVILSHGTLAISTFACIHGAVFRASGILLSYLPLAHIYERICELLTISLGGQIGYFTGDPLRLLEDAQILRPTYFPSVPRVLNRIYQGAMLSGDIPGFKGNLFRKACDVKLKKMRETGDNTHVFWDKLVFRKVQAVLGGRIETITCGSAPISADAMDFLRIAFACEVVEGYGMTENCGTCTRVWSNDPSSSGTVGPPQPSVEMKLIDVPSMGYFANDKPNPRGEICCRGQGCFKSYHNDPKNTADAVDSEGWIHTGDVGELDNHGRFKIVDRIKNIMKLAHGEYIALEKIENLYSTSPLVQQIYVHGDSLQDYLLAVVVPEPAAFAKLASKILGKHVSDSDGTALAQFMKDDRAAKAVLQELTKEARKAALKGFEMVKRIHLTMEPFSIENGLLTPTFKIKRKDASRQYQGELDALYALGPLVGDEARL